ncbi:hypothetical protein BLOT_003432 [Blomia tropicalis]|nr:hypothetical protein BLOT_003432 [Blomia tropicalis]
MIVVTVENGQDQFYGTVDLKAKLCDFNFFNYSGFDVLTRHKSIIRFFEKLEYRNNAFSIISNKFLCLLPLTNVISQSSAFFKDFYNGPVKAQTLLPIIPIDFLQFVLEVIHTLQPYTEKNNVSGLTTLY